MLPFIPLHILCSHFWQLVHCIELLQTGLPQTPHGHLAAFCISFWRSPLIINLVLFILNPISTEFQYPAVCVISATSPDRPGALCFSFFQCCSNFRDPDAVCWSFFNSSRYPMTPFILFIHQFFHVLHPQIFDPFSSTITLPDTPFRQFDPKKYGISMWLQILWLHIMQP